MCTEMVIALTLGDCLNINNLICQIHDSSGISLHFIPSLQSAFHTDRTATQRKQA